MYRVCVRKLRKNMKRITKKNVFDDAGIVAAVDINIWQIFSHSPVNLTKFNCRE